MRAKWIVGALLTLTLGFAGTACADVQQDAAQLEKLIAQIEKILPAGWTVAFELADERSRDLRPRLVVSSTERLPAEYIGSIGRPAAGADPTPYIVQENVQVHIVFVPYMSPQDYATNSTHNQELERQRRQFEEGRLKLRQSNYKGGFTPASYQRQTGDKSPLVREYALLWMNTEPRTLPTHHYGTLSVVAHDLHDLSSVTIKIHDAGKDEEFQQIIDGLETLFVPYTKTR